MKRFRIATLILVVLIAPMTPGAGGEIQRQNGRDHSRYSLSIKDLEWLEHSESG